MSCMCYYAKTDPEPDPSSVRRTLLELSEGGRVVHKKSNKKTPQPEHPKPKSKKDLTLEDIMEMAIETPLGGVC